MSWATYTATGSGKIAFRMMIEGLGYEAVTDSSMEKTTADGRVRAAGLILDSIIMDEQCHPSHGEISGSGMTIQILDRERDDIWTTALSKQPSKYAYITADSPAGDTTLTVADTDLWSAGDKIHFGTETMSISAKTATTLTVTRALWDTIDQKHFALTGADTTYASGTDVPAILEGRRAFFYAYGEGDSMTGDGTLVWRAICSSDAALGSDGTSWSISVDPIFSLLKEDMGVAAQGPLKPRGIYYPARYPFFMEIKEWQSPSPRIDLATSSFQINGHYEDNDSFVAAIDAKIQAATASWRMTRAWAEPRGADGWRIGIETASTASLVTYLTGQVLDPVDGQIIFQSTFDEDDVIILGGALSTTTDYYTSVIRQSIPRGFVGPNPTALEMPNTPSAYATNPIDRIYLNGDVSVTDLDSILVDWGNGYPDNEWFSINSSDAASRYVDINNSGRTRVWGNEGDLPEITFLRQFVSGGGSLSDFRDNIVVQSLSTANKGAMPFVTTSDLASWSDVIGGVASGDSFLSSRQFWASEKFTLEEVVAHECRLLGVFPVLDSSSKLSMAALRPIVPTDIGVVTLGADTILIDDGFPKWERNADGTIGTVRYKTGWDGEEHNGDEFIVRDVTAVSQMKRANTLAVEPRSLSLIEYIGGSPTYQGFVELSLPVLGMYGSQYAVLELDVSFKAFSVKCGDVVRVTHASIPDPSTGTRGISDKAFMVIGRTWEPHRARGRLRLMSSIEKFGGYSPSLHVQTASGSGTTWTLTVTWTDPAANITKPQPLGASPNSFIKTGDEIELIEWDASSPTRRTGNVTSDGGATWLVGLATIDVELDASWSTPSANSYIIRYNHSSSITTALDQKDHVHVASADGKLGYSDEDVSAFRFA